ncbi:MAG: carboxypeptidase regulatory-like domain-containing protein [Pseudomonadota bacterium]
MKKGVMLIFTLFIPIFVYLKMPLMAQEASLPIDIEEYQGIKYFSGGFGYDERDNLRKMGKNYGLKLVFSVKSGEYLADVGVQIVTSEGKTLLETVSKGPWFYARLSPGNYTVKAGSGGITQSKEARVGQGGQTMLHFVWGK